MHAAVVVHAKDVANVNWIRGSGAKEKRRGGSQTPEFSWLDGGGEGEREI